MKQEGENAVRARRRLELSCVGDERRVVEIKETLAGQQLADGSFDGSPLKTAGVLNLLDDLRAAGCKRLIRRGVGYLLSVLKSQPGYESAGMVKPGGLNSACDLAGFFGPYGIRNDPAVMSAGAAELNFYRVYEPLLGPKKPVREARRSTRDRAGPPSCYSWGLIPLAYLVETVCRAGNEAAAELAPALNVMLGVQRGSGGWCRNLGGHRTCTLHALRAIGAHSRLRRSSHARRALQFMRDFRKPNHVYAALDTVGRFAFPAGDDLLRDLLAHIVTKQQKNGSFGTPCPVERVAAVIMAQRRIGV